MPLSSAEQAQAAERIVRQESSMNLNYKIFKTNQMIEEIIESFMKTQAEQELRGIPQSFTYSRFTFQLLVYCSPKGSVVFFWET
jgi:hypothetical protein